jgi:uncharacterized protein
MAFDPALSPYVSLASFRQSGVEVRTPVWIAAHGGTCYVFSERRAGKVKRIRNNPRVRLAPCDLRGNLLGDWIEGTARLVDDPAEIEAMYPAFTRKYGMLMRIGNVFAKLSGRFNRRAIIAIRTTPEAPAPDPRD